MNIVQTVFEVFDKISEWIVGAVNDMVPIFYNTESGLTFLGTMALCGLGVGLILLIFNVVKSFIQFK